ncbi:MAG: outer membrane protein assembly factor BamE [Acetobacteraceae bacterium]
MRHLFPPHRCVRSPDPIRLFVIAALLLPLGACSLFSAPLNYRGQSVTSDQLKQLVPGTTTEADVTKLLGTPTSTGLFQPDRWSYISQVTHSRIARMPGVLRQNVVVLTFNDQGVLQNVRDLGKKSEVPVSMAAGATPSPGGHATFFQQLIGNVGRYTPTGLPGQTQGVGPAQGGLAGGEP